MAIICNLCGYDFLQKRYSFKGHSVMECRKCGLCFLHPMPDLEEVKKIYSKEYYLSPDSNAFGYSDYKKDVNLIILTAVQRYNIMKTAAEKRNNVKLLDVGCAYGYYLDIARLYGWDVEGVEIHKEAAEECVERLKLNVKKGTLEDHNFPPESVDILSCWDLIEHLLNPQLFFEEANRILKTGGYIFLTTPDVESLPAKITGKHWMGYKSREHTYFFSKTTMKRYFEKNGFVLEECKHIGKYISKDLLFERLKYYFGNLRFLAKPLKYILPTYFYLNPYDILFVRGKKIDSR